MAMMKMIGKHKHPRIAIHRKTNIATRKNINDNENEDRDKEKKGESR